MSRHALLIGINQYPLLRRVLPSGQTATRDLRGCVNDAHSIATLLRERYGFQTANIQLLTDENATRDGILAGLARLLASVGPDDLAVLFYAGHGSQMPDREGTKPSGWDETLVPHDSGRGAHPNRDITDDEIRLWLLQLCERTRFATLIFDCCHSATLNRSASGSDERSIERDERTVAELPPSPLDSDQLARLQALAQSPEMPWLPSGDRYVMLAACRERETAKEHTHSDGAQVAQAGALTFFLTEALRSAAAGATYRDVFEQASLEVLRRYPTQHPAAEGALDREFFGVKDSPTPLYVLVSKVQGDTVTLDAGEPQGVQLGSEYALYPPGTRELEVRGLDAATVPRLRVTSVGPLRAQGRLLAPGPVAARHWIVEPDLSSAFPFLAAALVTGGTVRMPGLPSPSLQPVDTVTGLLGLMNATVAQTDSHLEVSGDKAGYSGFDVDLHEVGELTPAVAALAALAAPGSVSTLRGVAHLRGHETDRLAALCTEINGLGGDCRETADGLTITAAPLHSGTWHAYADHRMAMAGAIVGLTVPGIEIDDIATTSKTLPEFPQLWAGMLAGE